MGDAEDGAPFRQSDLRAYVATFSSDFAAHAQQANLPRLALLLELVHREAIGDGKR